jgi:hypothetical protein
MLAQITLQALTGLPTFSFGISRRKPEPRRHYANILTDQGICYEFYHLAVVHPPLAVRNHPGRHLVLPRVLVQRPQACQESFRIGATPG